MIFCYKFMDLMQIKKLYVLDLDMPLERTLFVEIRKILEQMPNVTELHPVADAHAHAHVPVMKFKFGGVSTDLFYAELAHWVILEISKVCPKVVLGLDGLVSRSAAYYQQGACFAKWRTVVSILNKGS